MSGFVIQIVYVESVGDRESFAWYHGEALADDRKKEREDILRELNEIVAHATYDEATEWSRIVRSQDRSLVEVELERIAHIHNRLIATVVVSVEEPGDTWSADAAGAVARILGGEGLSVDVDRLAHALSLSHSRRGRRGAVLRWRGRPFSEPATVRSVIAGMLLAIPAVAWWRSRRNWKRRRKDEA